MGRYNWRGDYSEKTTVYLTAGVKKYLQLQAIKRNTTLSALINAEFADIAQRKSKT